jgi:gliding motility-associated-like protein
MRKLFLLTTFLLTTLFAFSQAPSNDNCSGAINIGTLPTPANCPSGVGAFINISGTNINATSPMPYTSLLGCQTGGNQPGPALDVWYIFTASGNQVNINITPGNSPILPNPAITLWSGSCGNLIGYNCDNNGTAGGSNSVTFQPVTPGQTYYIQISGMNNTSSGNFNMAINATNDCNNCLQTANLTVTPAPINGTYPPGTLVNFCYHITSYTQVNANWLHAVVPTFGCGWDLTTLSATPPVSCSNSGSWSWYNSWTSSSNSSVWGPGFAFNYTTPADGNPGNNFGDNCTTPNWDFCWSIKTKSNCTACTNLNVSINTAGDGESGSWTSIACQGDPNYTFGSVISCCTVTASATNVTCFGGNNGSATATPGTSGVAPFTYSWNSNPVQTTQTATNLSAGNYTVTAIDFNGCISTATVSITQPTTITVSNTQVNSTCGNPNGSSTANATGGIGPYTYLWSNGQTTQTATSLLPGPYTVTVTGIGGCIGTGSTNIVSTGFISASISPTNVSCFNGNNGSLYVSPTGGSSYTYLWSNGQTTQTATGLISGIYTVTITSSGCLITTTASITQPTQISVSTNTISTTCGLANGSISTNVSGGTIPYTYLWSNGQTTQTAINLISGVYSCTVTDANGCQSVVTNTLANTGSPISAVSTTSNVSCNGICNGQIQLFPNGGTLPYTYSWSNGSTLNPQSGMCSGTYSVIIRDANGCQFNLLNQIISQPLPLSITLSPTPSTICIGQTSNLSSNSIGGTLPYTYSWSNGSTLPNISITANATTGYTCTITDYNGCVSSSNTIVTVNNPLTIMTSSPQSICSGQSSTITANGAGGNGGPYIFTWIPGGNGQTIIVSPQTTTVYSVSISDGCNPNVSTTVSININPSPSINFSTTTLSGCEPLTVTYTSLTTGTVNCNWNINGVNYNNCLVTQTFPIHGSYNSILTVSDLNGCSSISPNIIANVYPMPTASFIANPEITDILNPLIVFNNTSSVGSYNWNFGDGNVSNSFDPAHTYSDTGMYKVELIVTTSYGCIDTTYGIIHIDDIFTVYVPNAFTPNNDGYNDSFIPIVNGSEGFVFSIFNRWGDMIYQSDNGSPWDSKYKGKEVQQDVYIWKLIVVDKRKIKHEYTGHVTVIR